MDSGQREEFETIYATHGHGDHFFGVNTIRKRFPNARFVARREVIAVMQKQASVPVVSTYWKVRFPGQIDSTLVIADELKEGVIELEGEKLVSVPLGHTDTDSTTCLHVPSIGLLVAVMLHTTMFIFIWESQTPQPERNGSQRLILSNLLSLWRLLPGTRGRTRQIHRILSKKQENISGILTGSLLTVGQRWNSTNRC